MLSRACPRSLPALIQHGSCGGHQPLRNTQVFRLGPLRSRSAKSLFCEACERNRISLSTYHGHHQSSSLHMREIRALFTRLMCSSSSSSSGTSSDPSSSSDKAEGKPEPSKPKYQRIPIDLDQTYTDNIDITQKRAQWDFFLDPKDLEDLPYKLQRSPYRGMVDLTVYKRRDVEKKAIEKWGSLEAVEQRRIKRAKYYRYRKLDVSYKEHDAEKEEEPYVYDVMKQKKEHRANIFKTEQGRLHIYGVVVNMVNASMTMFLWSHTNSHTMFAESILLFSLTLNQLIMLYGLNKSLQVPDRTHPYGWASFRYVSSLISGIGFCCIGAGMVFCRGSLGLANPGEMLFPFSGLYLLFGTFLSQIGMFSAAMIHTGGIAKMENISLTNYVRQGFDINATSLLVQNFASLVATTVASSFVGLSFYKNLPLVDASGAIVMAIMLGSLGFFLASSNSTALVGRSIPDDKRLELTEFLEKDRVIKAVHDVKATDMGGSFVRFKAEVDVDGQEITRGYLLKQDRYKLLEELQHCKTIEDAEKLLLRHGENITDTVGGEVNRIEKNLKSKHPEVRHVDLELN